MKTIFLILVTALTLQAQTLTGYLTESDSTIEFYSSYNSTAQWVEFILVDSSGNADSVVAEIRNPINNTWTKIGLKDQLVEDFVEVAVPDTVDKTGKLYIAWMAGPQPLRLRRTNVSNLSDKIYYYIRARSVK